MKALIITPILLLSLVLSVPVFAKGSHGGRSSSSHSHSPHASKKSDKSGSHDGHYEGGHGSSHAGHCSQDQPLAVSPSCRGGWLRRNGIGRDWRAAISAPGPLGRWLPRTSRHRR
jgi:hypothetical protein